MNIRFFVSDIDCSFTINIRIKSFKDHFSVLLMNFLKIKKIITTICILNFDKTCI